MNLPASAVPGRQTSAADDADRAILERIAGGDHGAIEALYERYKSMTYALALRITGDAAPAEDAVQDAFIGAWRNAARYEHGRGAGRLAGGRAHPPPVAAELGGRDRRGPGGRRARSVERQPAR